jgi:lysophospholipase L1-like esterase
MPRKAKRRERIQELNDRYRRIAHARGIRYLDLWPALADENGALNRAFTADDLHLNGAGYRAWIDLLRPVVEGADEHR